MSNAFDEAVKRLMLELRKYWFYKSQDGLRCLDEDIAKGLRPLFDKQRDEIGKLTDQLYSVTTSIHDKADKVHVLQVVEIDSLQATIAERDKEIERLREGLQKYGLHKCSCGFNACVSAPCDCGLDAALADKPGSKEEE